MLKENGKLHKNKHMYDRLWSRISHKNALVFNIKKIYKCTFLPFDLIMAVRSSTTSAASNPGVLARSPMRATILTRTTTSLSLKNLSNSFLMNSSTLPAVVGRDSSKCSRAWKASVDVMTSRSSWTSETLWRWTRRSFFSGGALASSCD